jgi:uncharacterized membrane protein
VDSLYLKQAAREKLQGFYMSAVFGAVLYYIPVYIISLIITLTETVAKGYELISILISTVLSLCVVEVLMVGFMRSLLKINDGAEKYDANVVLSPYQKNFKNTLKIMFCKEIYLWGWEMLPVLPFLFLAGVMAFTATTEQISQLITMSIQLFTSVSDVMVMNIYNFMVENFSYVFVLAPVAWIASLILCIPAIRKNYEYQMIPILLAENPDISRKDAFARTKEIMKGYKLRFFSLQLSFFWLMLLGAFVAGLTESSVAYYLVNALIMPYVYMAYLQFYIFRTRLQTGDIPECGTEQDILKNDLTRKESEQNEN